jgi:hypothetical protein
MFYQQIVSTAIIRYLKILSKYTTAIISGCDWITYTSVSQTMVRGPQVVLEVCPCGPSKKTEEKITFK